MADPVKIDVKLKGERAAVVKALRGMADSLDLDAPPPSPPETPAPPENPEDDPREREYVIVQTTVETLAHGEVPTCECGNDAVCVGVAEGRLETLAVMCDECCGHGNEDGWCVPLEKFYPSKRRAAPETPAPEGAARIECPRCLHVWCPACGATEGEPCTNHPASPASAPRETTTDPRDADLAMASIATAAMIRADAFEQAARLVEGIAPDFVDVDVLAAALRAMAELRESENHAPASVCTWDVRVVCPVPADVAIDCSTSCPLRTVQGNP